MNIITSLWETAACVERQAALLDESMLALTLLLDNLSCESCEDSEKEPDLVDAAMLLRRLPGYLAMLRLIRESVQQKTAALKEVAEGLYAGHTAQKEEAN